MSLTLLFNQSGNQSGDKDIYSSDVGVGIEASIQVLWMRLVLKLLQNKELNMTLAQRGDGV